MSATRLVGWLVANDRRAVVTVSVFGVVLLWARAPFALRNFYAEDGAVHYKDASTIGFIDSLRTKPFLVSENKSPSSANAMKCHNVAGGQAVESVPMFD